MPNVNDVMSLILEGMKGTFEEVKLIPVIPEGMQRGETPVVTENGHSYVTLDAENASVRIEFSKNRVSLLSSGKTAEESLEGDYDQIAQCLLDIDRAKDGDVESACEEFSETLLTKYSRSKTFVANQKMPTPISKAAVRSGAVTYDLNTLASRLTEIYPELRSEYKANIDRYSGEFLAEEFFIEHANAAIVATIKENNAKKMKKLFNLLNDIYDNGTNDIQSLLAVTVMGSLENDQTLLANCVDYMSADLCNSAIQVNKYLASAGAKGMRMKLKNPPLYKPKREKKKNGFMQNLMGTGTDQLGK